MSKRPPWREPERMCWYNILARCLRPSHPKFPSYGGRGIRVCERWRQSFQAFLGDVGRRPSVGYSIERIDNDGHYEPGNVRWATRKEQQRNRRSNRYITIGGETRPAIEWAEMARVKYKTFRVRLELGWSGEDLLRPPLMKGKQLGNRQSDWTLADAKIVTPDDVQRILSRAKEAGAFSPMMARDYDFMAIAVNSGLRLSEVAHIEKDDVLPTRLMMTRRKKRHLNPAPIEVMPVVHEILRRRAAAVESGYIFPGNAQVCIIHRSKTDKDTKVRTQWDEQVCVGGHCSLRSIQRRWRLLIEELGIYKYGRGIHSLRHTAITEVYRTTKDILKAQKFAGHSSPDITVRYSHILDMQDTLNKMVPLT